MPKRRPYNTLGRRILALLAPENGGPRSRTVLEGYAAHHGHGPRRFDATLKRLIDTGLVVVVGEKRGTRYARGTRAAS